MDNEWPLAWSVLSILSCTLLTKAKELFTLEDKRLGLRTCDMRRGHNRPKMKTFYMWKIWRERTYVVCTDIWNCISENWCNEMKLLFNFPGRIACTLLQSGFESNVLLKCIVLWGARSYFGVREKSNWKTSMTHKSFKKRNLYHCNVHLKKPRLPLGTVRQSILITAKKQL